MTQATGYQRKTAKRKIILLLIILVVGMFIVLLVKPKRSARAQAPKTDDSVTDGKSKTVKPNNVNGGWDSVNGAPFHLNARVERLSSTT